jgi:CubicO group peptidase (beta-lactamase class C family)
MRRLLLLVLLLLAVPLRGEGAAAGLDAFARNAMRRLGTTPGLSVVVVRDDAIVYQGDLGLRDVESRLPVTRDTRFYIASTTKAFTAMTAAIVAEEGKLDLDAPVASVWPELKLTAPLDPKRFSLRDFLAMRSGLANDSLNFRIEIGNVRTEDELLRLLAVYSSEQPRTFRYSNMSYLIAARIVEHATGRRWADLVAEKILLPLGMTSTLTGPAPAEVPVARFYRADAAGTFVRTPSALDEMAGPAGGMLMTTTDAAKWLMALMNDGRAGGRQALPRHAVRIVQSPQTTNKRRFRYIDRFAWGLGQDLGEYEGELIVHRFGGLNGAYSHVSFMPDRRIGVAVFANGGGAVPDAVAAYAYDLLLGRKDLAAKWSAELERAAASVAEAREQRRKAEAPMAQRSALARPAEAYAARYHYDRLGDIDVTAQNDRLYAQFGLYRAELVPVGKDAFLIDWVDEGQPASIQFVVDATGTPSRIDWVGRIFERAAH